jgi:hypothetical protein
MYRQIYASWPGWYGNRAKLGMRLSLLDSVDGIWSPLLTAIAASYPKVNRIGIGTVLDLMYEPSLIQIDRLNSALCRGHLLS